MSRTATISKNGTRPAYEIGNVWRWVEYPAFDLVGENFPYSEAYEGFAVEVLMNPKGDDERAATFALREYLRRLRELTETDPDNQQLVDAAAESYLQVLAPRIRAWNAVQDGGQAIPAPSDSDGLDAFCRFPDHLRNWVTAVVREISIPKRRTPPSLSVGPGATPTPSAMPPDPEPLDS